MDPHRSGSRQLRTADSWKSNGHPEPPQTPLDHANVEVHILVQARFKSTDESDCADVQGGLVHIRRTGAVGK